MSDLKDVLHLRKGNPGLCSSEKFDVWYKGHDAYYEEIPAAELKPFLNLPKILSVLDDTKKELTEAKKEIETIKIRQKNQKVLCSNYLDRITFLEKENNRLQKESEESWDIKMREYHEKLILANKSYSGTYGRDIQTAEQRVYDVMRYRCRHQGNNDISCYNGPDHTKPCKENIFNCPLFAAPKIPDRIECGEFSECNQFETFSIQNPNVIKGSGKRFRIVLELLDK